nr:GPI mannosyltransferase 2 [Ipomoea batatas]GME04402.1 GPI mannosyltransferase 2 [Ipomoea batatas]
MSIFLSSQLINVLKNELTLPPLPPGSASPRVATAHHCLATTPPSPLPPASRTPGLRLHPQSASVVVSRHRLHQSPPSSRRLTSVCSAFPAPAMVTNSSSFQANSRTLLVLKYAIASRLLLIFLILLWRWILSPYDTSASINPSCLPSEWNSHTSPVLLPRVAAAIEDSIVWDSVYFVRIAQCGYEYEQAYAFFPLLPISISLLSRTVFSPLIPLVGHRAVLGLSGYVLNNIAFVLAALYLYRLSAVVVKDSELALRASILFCFNPASIFYSSIYTESLYALLSIGGLYYFTSGARNIATLCFALSGFSRSNGILNAGYICFQTMHSAYSAVFIKKSAFFAFRVLLAGAIRCLCIIFPFVAFQAYGYYNMCLGHSPGEARPWCKARLPLLYDYIQSHYWGVGFLRYFQIKQIPNFLLASPILSLALCSIIHYVKLQPKVFLSLGFQTSSMIKGQTLSPFSKGTNVGQKSADFAVKDTSSKLQGNNVLKHRKQAAGSKDSATIPSETGKSDNPDLSTILVPFIFHLGFMVATAFLVMHVQVATRFLSASPPLYWFGSYIMASPHIGKRWGYCIWAYCSAYIFLGSLLFSNFYPFT